MSKALTEPSSLTITANVLSLKLTHTFLKPYNSIIGFFRRDPVPEEPVQPKPQPLEEDTDTVAKPGMRYSISVDKGVVELGQQLETQTFQRTPFTIFQNILRAQFEKITLEIYQQFRISTNSCKVYIQHPWYNITLPFIEVSIAVYEYNYADLNTRISIAKDASIKVNDLSVNALQSLSALLSTGTSAFVTFCNLTNDEILLVSQDFAKKDIARQLRSGESELMHLSYTPFMNEYSIGFRQEDITKPYIFTNKHKIPELKSDQELNILGEYLEKYYIRPFYKPESKQLVAIGLCHQHYIVNFLAETLTVVFPKNNGLSNGEVSVPSSNSKLKYSVFLDSLSKDNTFDLIRDATPLELSRQGLKTKKILIKFNESGSYYNSRELTDVNQSIIYLYDINCVDPNKPAFYLSAHLKGGVCIWEVNSLIHINNNLQISGKIELKFLAAGGECKDSLLLDNGENIVPAGKSQFYNQYFDLVVHIIDSEPTDTPQIGPPMEKVTYCSESIKLKGFSNEVAELLKEKRITRDVPLKHIEDTEHQSMIRVQVHYEGSKLYLSLSHLFSISNRTPFSLELSYSKKCPPIGLRSGESTQSLLNISFISKINVLLISQDFPDLEPVPVQIKNFLKAHYAIVTFADTIYKSATVKVNYLFLFSGN